MTTQTTPKTLWRHAQDRGQTRISWLNSYHTFSFGDYYDPQFMGFGDLRVINDDIVAPSGGFATHGHKDMEIVTIVLSGELEHKDSMGNGSVIRPGDVQRMSAGTGVQHSEFNPSDANPVHLLQIWILPRARNLPTGYEQRFISEQDRKGQLRLIASPDGRDGSLSVQQDMALYATILDADETIRYDLPENRILWLHVATGTVELDGQLMEAGAGAGIRQSGKTLNLKGLEANSQVLLFELKA